MLLSMQNIISQQGEKIQDGLVPDDLKGIQTESKKRWGAKFLIKIKEF